MSFKMIDSKNTSVCAALFLIVLLSQSDVFNFLVETVWGRLMLITLLIIISYVNKILGSVVVLFIIIMFNQSDVALFEGFTSDASGNNSDASGNNSDASGNKSNVATAKIVSNNTDDTTSSTPAKEGFDVIGTENAIKRGKQSNSIPTTNFTNDADDSISPYEGFPNSQTFSSV